MKRIKILLLLSFLFLLMPNVNAKEVKNINSNIVTNNINRININNSFNVGEMVLPDEVDGGSLPQNSKKNNNNGIIDLCESYGFLQALLILKTIFNIVCYIIPIILIFTLSLDIYKLVMNPDDSKKVWPIVKKRLIAAIIIFLIPTLVRAFLSFLGGESDVKTCWNNANSDYISALKNK